MYNASVNTTSGIQMNQIRSASILLISVERAFSFKPVMVSIAETILNASSTWYVSAS